MNSRVVSCVACLYALVSLIWLMFEGTPVQWLVPLIWAIGVWFALNGAVVAITGVAASLLIYLIETGKVWSTLGYAGAVELLSAPAPRQLILLSFFYLPVLAIFLSLDLRVLAADLKALGLWKIRVIRRLCVILLFVIALREAIKNRLSQILATISLRGFDRAVPGRMLVLSPLWAPALIRLTIVEAIERSQIHSFLSVRPGRWEPSDNHSRFSRTEWFVFSLSLLTIFIVIPLAVFA